MRGLLSSGTLHAALIALVAVAIANRTSFGRQLISGSGSTWF